MTFAYSSAAPVAIVLGATSGLGRATAAALVAAGSDVIITGRDSARTLKVAEELGARSLAVDLTDAESVSTFCEVIAKEPVTQLVLNSGGPPPGRAIELTSSAVRVALQMLLLSHIEIVAVTLPGMIERGIGRIVGIGSSAVQQPIPDLALSNIGRTALAAYLKSLAADVAAKGITVNMVLPGRIATPRVASLDEAAALRERVTTDTVRSRSHASIPAGRYGRPEEFAAAVAFLCGADAAYITGEQIRVDGGMIRHF